MVQRSGSADLPLHGGRVPKWLGDRMTRLGAVITEAIVLEYGRGELLRRLAHPFWFQSFGAVMGMDWHSSGITTSVIGALKRGLPPLSRELGVHVCGGRGNHSRQTPHELVAIGDRTGLDGVALAKASGLVAKVDSAAVQDGFDLYLHGFIVTDDGHWVAVQQGMNADRRQARRLGVSTTSMCATPSVALSISSPISPARREARDLQVNGINGRLPVLLRWFDAAAPDIVCLQELKAPQEKFPEGPIRDVGFGMIWHGQKSWNGVAILSKRGAAYPVIQTTLIAAT